MILLSVLLLSVGCPSIPEQEPVSPIEFTVLPAAKSTSVPKKVKRFFHAIYDSTLYFGAGTLLGAASIITGVGWGICQVTPWTSATGRECGLLSQMCGKAAIHSFAQMISGSPSSFSSFKRIPFSQSSWYNNQKMLSQVPASSQDDQELLLFLENRWLAKCTGCYPGPVDWIYPAFNISVQVHPETTNSYARDPWNKLSQTYIKRVASWKHHLPHPEHFPLILTRPFNIQEYLPSCLAVLPDESVQQTVENIVISIKGPEAKLIVDLTEVIVENDRQQWLQNWQSYQDQLIQACEERGIDTHQILCVQRIQDKEIGGLRLLPLTEENLPEQHLFLLERVSKFGLSANRVELDRCTVATTLSTPHEPLNTHIPKESREQFIAYLDGISWTSDNPQKTLMYKGTLEVLKGLFTTISNEKWDVIMNSPTRSFIAHLSMMKIKQQLQQLALDHQKLSFFETASRIELIHADLTALLEIFTPYQREDFAVIYQSLLKIIPSELQPLSSYALHSSGMTSLCGIFKAAERTLGQQPRILYGENTYFECIYAAERDAHASSTLQATEQEWEEVDLILAQFNPALKRIDFQITEYIVEKIADVVHRALNARHKPLTLAVDCTLDYINSSRVSLLLTEFEPEIAHGDLNVICYRSGLKFDLFGMDNYCGAPFFMVHNDDEKWQCFDTLLTEPALQTDRLSCNWFCLAYHFAGPFLEDYRKQIFDNTRDLLNRVPTRLFSDRVNYRIIPMEPDADPSFIDFKVFGALHAMRGSLLAGGLPSIKALEAGHPLFYRPSLGFFHPNLNMLYGKECTTVRLTLGLDPTQVDTFVAYFELMNTLNGR